MEMLQKQEPSVEPGVSDTLGASLNFEASAGKNESTAISECKLGNPRSDEPVEDTSVSPSSTGNDNLNPDAELDDPIPCERDSQSDSDFPSAPTTGTHSSQNTPTNHQVSLNPIPTLSRGNTSIYGTTSDAPQSDASHFVNDDISVDQDALIDQALEAAVAAHIDNDIDDAIDAAFAAVGTPESESCLSDEELLFAAMSKKLQEMRSKSSLHIDLPSTTFPTNTTQVACLNNRLSSIIQANVGDNFSGHVDSVGGESLDTNRSSLAHTTIGLEQKSLTPPNPTTHLTMEVQSDPALVSSVPPSPTFTVEPLLESLPPPSEHLMISSSAIVNNYDHLCSESNEIGVIEGVAPLPAKGVNPVLPSKPHRIAITLSDSIPAQSQTYAAHTEIPANALYAAAIDQKWERCSCRDHDCSGTWDVLTRENADLKRQLQEATLQIQELEILRKENERLQARVAFLSERTAELRPSVEAESCVTSSTAPSASEDFEAYPLGHLRSYPVGSVVEAQTEVIDTLDEKLDTSFDYTEPKSRSPSFITINCLQSRIPAVSSPRNNRKEYIASPSTTAKWTGGGPATQSSEEPEAQESGETLDRETTGEVRGALAKALDSLMISDYFESDEGDNPAPAPRQPATGLWNTPQQSSGQHIKLILKLHDKEEDEAVLAQKQNYRCAGCGGMLGQPVSDRRGSRRAIMANFCYYTGKVYCVKCHQGGASSREYIPARVVRLLDFRMHPVCRLAQEYLRATFTAPSISVSAINPELYRQNKDLNLVRKLRLQLSHIKAFVETCRKRDSLMGLLGDRAYLMADLPNLPLKGLTSGSGSSCHRGVLAPTCARVFSCTDMGDSVGSNQDAATSDVNIDVYSSAGVLQLDIYSMRDFVDVFNGSLTPWLETIVSELGDHIMNGSCEICASKGTFCQVPSCNDSDNPIYPFQLHLVIQCALCRAFFHQKCFDPDGPSDCIYIIYIPVLLAFHSACQRLTILVITNRLF